MVTPLLLMGVTFLFVFAKAFQQRNVIHNNWLLIPVFSYMLGFLELSGLSIGVLEIAENGWSRLIVLGLASGTGGWTGCYVAMWMHNKVKK